MKKYPFNPTRFTDPDVVDPRHQKILSDMLTTSLKRCRQAILEPKGGSPESIQWNRQRAISQYNQIAGELAKLKKNVADWSGKTISASLDHGWKAAGEQLRSIGWDMRGMDHESLKTNWNAIDAHAVRALALDTYQDMQKAIDTTGDRMHKTLFQMADNGLTAADVNKIIAGGILSGHPTEPIRQLRQMLRAADDGTITVKDKNGDDMTFQADDYAKMVVQTRTRQASVIGRTARLKEQGVEHVIIIGRQSDNPCTAYLGKIFCIGKSDGVYPSLEEIDGPPFHPRCSKSTAPIVLELATEAQVESGKPDEDSTTVQKMGNTSKAVRAFKDLQIRQQVEGREKKVVQSIRQRAKDAGYNPPPFSPTSADLRPAVTAQDDVRLQEDIIRKLGIKDPFLGQNPGIGVHAVQAVQMAANAGLKLPEKFQVDASEFQDSEHRINRDYIGKASSRGVFLNPAWEGWSDLTDRMNDFAKRQVLSTDRPAHIPLHELVHYDAVVSGVDHRNEKFHIGSRDLDVASTVSTRAARNKDEFVAEVRAGIILGRKFGLDVMELYQSLGGRL